MKVIKTLFILLLFNTIGYCQFSYTTVQTSFNRPIGLDFDDTGKMYVWERRGNVFIVENGVKLTTPLINIQEEVGLFGDLGLTGFALDPDFNENGFFYLLYSVNPHHLQYFGTAFYNSNTANQDYAGATIARVTRYTASLASQRKVADLSTRVVLVGESITTGIPLIYSGHGIGSLSFGTDKTLLVSIGDQGDAANFDLGSSSNTFYQEGLNLGILPSNQNIGIYRTQMLESYHGKILRIDPSNGDGLSSNPYYESASPRSAKSRVYTIGLRNPFRFSVLPNSGSHQANDGMPGTLLVGDVGRSDNEEFNVVKDSIFNGGWPYYEGIDKYFSFLNTSSFPAPAIYNRPMLEYRTNTRNFINGQANTLSPSIQGSSSIGGVFYPGNAYGTAFKDKYFHADFDPGWIKALDLNSNLEVTGILSVLDNSPYVTCLAYNPADELLYFINVTNNEVNRIDFLENRTPTAVLEKNKTNGNSPLVVGFNAELSSDPENTALSFLWNFGDGDTSTAQSPSHTYVNNGAFNVSLTVTDGDNKTNSVSDNVYVGNEPPIIHSTSLDNIDKYNTAGFSITASAIVSDENESNSTLSYKWQVFLYHNTHNHLEAVFNDSIATLTLPELPCDDATYFHKVTLEVTDSFGQKSFFEHDIYYDCKGINDNIKPSNVDNLIVITEPRNKNTLKWLAATDNDGIDTYEIRQNGAWKATIPADNTSYELQNLYLNRLYSFEVIARDSSGNVSSNNPTIYYQNQGYNECSFTILTDQPPIASSGSIHFNQTNTNQTLMLNNIPYPKGCFSNNGGSVTYSIPSNTSRFEALWGISDEVNNPSCGSMRIKVFLDNVLAYTSPTISSLDEPLWLDISVLNKNTIQLTIENVGSSNGCNLGVIAMPKFIPCDIDIIAPTIPINISSSNVDDNSFNISWTASSDNYQLKEYQIYMNGSLYGTTTNENININYPVSSDIFITVEAIDFSGNVSKSAVFNKCPFQRVVISGDNTSILSALGYISTSGSFIQNDAHWTAGKAIVLNPGITVPNGVLFKLEISNCN